jgi:hypothetical protein
MALTTERESIEQVIRQLERSDRTESLTDVSRRLDALLEAVEILAQDRYEFPGAESRMRWAMDRARRSWS